MLSRRATFVLSVALTLAVYALLLWLAPHITLLEADRMTERITTRFPVAFLDAPPPAPREAVPRAPADEMPRPDETRPIFSAETEVLDIDDTPAAPSPETLQVAERLAEEAVERVHDIAPEPERARIMDTRILEIAETDARREIDIARRLVRPSPEHTLPMEALPALRSRDPGHEDIALEPVRIGGGLLVEAMPSDAPPEMTDTRPPYEEIAIEAAEEDAAEEQPVLDVLEQVVARVPVEVEAERARTESTYEFMDELVDIRLDTYVRPQEQRGYFRLRILPRDDAAITPLPRDVVFVLDASRSMQQRKLDLVVRGLADVLAGFRPEDRFNILLFRDTVTMFRDAPVYATPENISAAQTLLTELESRGQTDVYNALLPVAQLRPRPNLPGIVVVVSDGVPTTGVRDSRAIINTVTADNALRNSIFAYGAGNMVDRYLLDLLAYRNKGRAFVSDSIHQAREDIAVFLQQLDVPILVDLRAGYGRVAHEDVYPRVIPDFYQDVPIALYGRFDPQGDDVFVARITGHAGDEKKEIVFRAPLSQATPAGAEIAQGWAFQKAYHLIGEISRQGEEPALLGALHDLSEKYNIRTIYDE